MSESQKEEDEKGAKITRSERREAREACIASRRGIAIVARDL